MKKIYEKTMEIVTANDFDFSASTIQKLIGLCFYDEYNHFDDEHFVEAAVAWSNYIIEEVTKIDFPNDKADELLRIANIKTIINFMIRCNMEKELIEALDNGELFESDFISLLLYKLDDEVNTDIWLLSFIYIPEYAKVLFDKIEELGYLNELSCVTEILEINDDALRKKMIDIATEKNDSWIWANIINIVPDGTELFFTRIPRHELVECVYGMFDCRFHNSSAAVDALYCITEFVCENEMVEEGKELLKLIEESNFDFKNELYWVEKMICSKEVENK